jgi:hypothetical protein
MIEEKEKSEQRNNDGGRKKYRKRKKDKTGKNDDDYNNNNSIVYYQCGDSTAGRNYRHSTIIIQFNSIITTTRTDVMTCGVQKCYNFDGRQD